MHSLQTTQAYEALAESDADADVVGRVFLYSTLPLCVLLVALIVGKLLTFVWQDIVGILKFVRKALSPYTQRCCARLDEELVDDYDDDCRVEEGAWRRQERGGKGKAGALAAWRKQRVNNFPPYTRKFEIMYHDRSRVPDVPPGWYVCVCVVWMSDAGIRSLQNNMHPTQHTDSGWEVELTPGIRTSQRMNVVKLVKRWTSDELSASTAPNKNREALALAAAGVTAEGSVVYKKTWEVIKEGGGLHTYALEANPDYEPVMLVRMTLHLSAKSLLGLETSRRLDWTRALESMRATQRGWSASEHDDGSDDDDNDDDNEAEAEAHAPQRRWRPQKVRARKAASRFVSLLLLEARHSKEEGAKGPPPAAVADSA